MLCDFTRKYYNTTHSVTPHSNAHWRNFSAQICRWIRSYNTDICTSVTGGGSQNVRNIRHWRNRKRNNSHNITSVNIVVWVIVCDPYGERVILHICFIRWDIYVYTASFLSSKSCIVLKSGVAHSIVNTWGIRLFLIHNHVFWGWILFFFWGISFNHCISG